MPFTILQQIILGMIQGITEWLPISSSAALILIMSNFFAITDLHDLIVNALFFHLGTFFAALIYFRKDVVNLLITLFHYKSSKNISNKKTLNFIIITTIISGILGFLIIKLLFSFESQLAITGKTISFAIGVLLLFTGLIQLKGKGKRKSKTSELKKSKKTELLKKSKELKLSDSILLGFTQGISVLPGLSRSGITVSSLLLKKFDDTSALRLSFLMSLPVIFFGSIFLSLEYVVLTSTAIYGVLASFIFGLLTISLLMNLSKKINFGWFVIMFGLLMIVSVIF